MTDDESDDNFIQEGIKWNDIARTINLSSTTTTNDYKPHEVRLRSMSNESDMHTKRHRAGSISGRLRTASDLEECGLIDKNQKGVLKVRYHNNTLLIYQLF